MPNSSQQLKLREQDLSQDATELPRRFPLVFSQENRSDSTAKDAKLVNCYAEKNPMTGDYSLFGRPGTSVNTTLSGNGNGIFNWIGDVYSIFGSVIYKNGSSHGTGLNTAGGRYRFDPFLTPSRLLFKNTTNAYITDGTTVTAIADADFPGTTVPGWAFLDAAEYVMTPAGAIQGSDLNAPTSWDPLNVITAQIEPDRGVALAKQLVYVLALKEWSTEVFYDAGTSPGSPLGRAQGPKINWGCIAAGTLQEVCGALFWIATYKKGDQSNGVGVILKVDGLKADVVSSPAIERLLETADYTATWALSLSVNGHTFYVVTIKNSNLTLAYDVGEKLWSQWTDSAGNYWPFVGATNSATAQNHLVQHETDGKIYNVSTLLFSDVSFIIPIEVVTPNFDGGVRWAKQLAKLAFIGDQTPGQVLQVSANDWDYDPTKWTADRLVKMSVQAPFLDDCGTFLRRAYRIRSRCPARFHLAGMELKINLGTADML